MYILFLKALHIVGFVAWFAGLFYLVRIFVYHAEAGEKGEPEKSILQKQFTQMQWRVYRIICNPAMMITWTAGIVMLVLNPTYLQMGWMHIKLTLLVVLLGYHLYCTRVIRRQEAGEEGMTPWQLRLFNEIPTLFLVAITFLAVYGKAGGLNYLYFIVGLVLFSVLIYGGARAYKMRREGSGG